MHIPAKERRRKKKMKKIQRFTLAENVKDGVSAEIHSLTLQSTYKYNTPTLTHTYTHIYSPIC